MLTYEPLSALETLALSGLTGDQWGVVRDIHDGSTPTGLTKKMTFADLRTALLGGTLAGYNASDPLNAGATSVSTFHATAAAIFGSTVSLGGQVYTWPGSKRLAVSCSRTAAEISRG